MSEDEGSLILFKVHHPCTLDLIPLKLFENLALSAGQILLTPSSQFISMLKSSLISKKIFAWTAQFFPYQSSLSSAPTTSPRL